MLPTKELISVSNLRTKKCTALLIPTPTRDANWDATQQPASWYSVTLPGREKENVKMHCLPQDHNTVRTTIRAKTYTSQTGV